MMASIHATVTVERPEIIVTRQGVIAEFKMSLGERELEPIRIKIHKHILEEYNMNLNAIQDKIQRKFDMERLGLKLITT